jgi:hypothetical protein
MHYINEDNERSAPLLELLINQCDHLEDLMGLARKQLEAMRNEDPNAVADIGSEQDELGKQLEISQQKINRKML